MLPYTEALNGLFKLNMLMIEAQPIPLLEDASVISLQVPFHTVESILQGVASKHLTVELLDAAIQMRRPSYSIPSLSRLPNGDICIDASYFNHEPISDTTSPNTSSLKWSTAFWINELRQPLNEWIIRENKERHKKLEDYCRWITRKGEKCEPKSE